MNSDVPKILYKHRTWDTDLHKDILRSNKIFFSSASNFNDPFDASLPYKYADEELTFENIRKKLFEIGRRINPDFSEEKLESEVNKRQNEGIFLNEQYWKDLHPDIKNQLHRDFGIFCLTQKKDDLLMWSHYSNSHTGFCIGFDTKVVFEVTKCTLGPITYDDKFPTMPLFNLNPEDLLKLLMTKSKHWEYESEARMIKTLGANITFELPNEAFKEIIFGCKISEVVRNELIHLCSAK